MERTTTARMSGLLAVVVAAGAAVPRASVACGCEAGPWVDLEMTRGVKERQPVEMAGEFVAGETAYAWTNVHEFGGGQIEHVWSKDDREVARHRMDVGGARWRTWSRHRLGAGHYVIEVMAGDELLARHEFVVPATMTPLAASVPGQAPRKW